MPKYAFECLECQLYFERYLKTGEHTTHECPSCRDAAPLVITGFGFSFGGGATANSGVHKQDYPTADQAVGRSAEDRWKVISAREQVKKEARKQGGTPALIRHTGRDYIDYEPMSEAGKSARRKLAQEAFKAVAEGKR